MPNRELNRRTMLGASLAFGGLGLAGCATQPRAESSRFAGLSAQDIPPPLAPIRAHTDRLFDIKVCIRPFRDQGPRIWMSSRSATRWWSTITAMAAAAGRCPGARPTWRCRRPCRTAPRDRGDRLRHHRAHLGHHGPARRRAGHDLYPRTAAAHALGARQWQLDAGFAHRLETRRAPLRRHLGTDGARSRGRPFASIWACPAIRSPLPITMPCPTTPFAAGARGRREAAATLGFRHATRTASAI